MNVFIIENQGWQGNYFEWQVPEQRRFPHGSYNNTNVDNHTNVNSPNFLNVLDSYSSKQAIPRQLLTPYLSMMEVPELLQSHGWDHIEMVAENTSVDPLEVSISKLKLNYKNYCLH